MFRCARTAAINASRCGGHDSAFDVLIEREDGDGLLPNGEGGCGHNRRELAGEATAIKGQLAFQDRLGARDFLAVVARDGFDDGLRLRDAQRADALHRLAQAFEPELAVRVEHDFNGLGIVEGGQQLRPHVAFELLLRPFLDAVVFWFLVGHSVCPVCRCVSRILYRFIRYTELISTATPKRTRVTSAATLHRGLQGRKRRQRGACSVRPRAEPVAFALWVVRGLSHPGGL